MIGVLHVFFEANCVLGEEQGGVRQLLHFKLPLFEVLVYFRVFDDDWGLARAHRYERRQYCPYGLHLLFHRTPTESISQSSFHFLIGEESVGRRQVLIWYAHCALWLAYQRDVYAKAHFSNEPEARADLGPLFVAPTSHHEQCRHFGACCQPTPVRELRPPRPLQSPRLVSFPLPCPWPFTGTGVG